MPDKTRPAAPRNEAIDVIRLIAAAGIVFIHAVKRLPPSPLVELGNFFRFAVPFYLFASLYFQSRSLRSNTSRTLPQYVAGRFKRLYFPFLAWSLIYLAARNAKRLLLSRGTLGAVDLEIGLLWKGTEIHLWFLPFLLFWSIVLPVMYWGLLKRNRAWRWPVIAVAIAAGFVFAACPMPSWDETFPSPTYAYVQFWRSLPASCWALAFALFMTMGPVVRTIPTSLGIAGILLATTCSLWQVLRGIQLIPRGLSGLGCMLAALMPWSLGPRVAVLAKIGRYSYGIYLCHVLVVEVVRIAFDRSHLGPSVAMDLAIFVVSLLGSVALVLLLARSWRTAWLNG